MEWSIGTHKYTQRRCWKVIYESHVTLSTGEMELSSALSSPQMMSHLLLQHGDDLTDSSRHRRMALAMTYTCDCLSAIWSLIAFILFQFENCFNQQPQHLQRAGWGYLRVFVCVDVVVVISREPNQEAKHTEGFRESPTQWNKREKNKRESFDLAITMAAVINCLINVSSDTSTHADNRHTVRDVHSASMNIMANKYAQHVQYFANQHNPFGKQTNLCDSFMQC